MIISGNQLKVRFEKDNLNFIKVIDETFENNLMLIDSYMPKLYGELVKIGFLRKNPKVARLVEMIESLNPIRFSNKLMYEYKYKKLIRAFVLEIPLDKPWDGKENYLLIPEIYKKFEMKDRFNLYNLSSFEEFILNNSEIQFNISDNVNIEYFELNVKIIINFKLYLVK